MLEVIGGGFEVYTEVSNAFNFEIEVNVVEKNEEIGLTFYSWLKTFQVSEKTFQQTVSTNRVWGLSNCVLNLFTNDAFVGMSQYHLIPQNMLLNGKTILINVLLLSAPDKRRDLSSIIQFLVFFNCKISLRTYGTTPTY